MAEPDPLVDRATAALRAVLPLLDDACKRGSDKALELRGFPVWVRDPRLGEFRSYRAQARVFSAERQCALRVFNELREIGLREILDLEEALRADEIIGPRMAAGSAVSHAAGGGAWQAQGQAAALLERAVDEAGGFDVGSVDVDRLATEWAADLRRPADVVTVVVACREFESEVTPFELEPNLVIDELDDAEVSAALQLGAGRRGPFADETMIARTFGIHCSFESRLFPDSVPAAEQEREEATRADAIRTCNNVVSALRVYKAGRIGITATFQYTTRFGEVAPVQGTFLPSFGWPMSQPYVMGADDVEPFRDFWQAFQTGRGDRVIASALRRFDYAADRSLPEDVIVDLLVAAESLFLDPSNRTELGFRLAARVAALLGTSVDERVALLTFMGKAYNARSTIVHGSELKAKDMRDLAGKQVAIHEFANQVEDVVRRALKIAIGRVAAGDGFPPDWERLILQGPS